MSYANFTYYSTIWKGESAESDISKYLERASDDIDMITDNQIDISELTTKQLDYLKKANCIQADYYVSRGYDEDVYNSLSIGKVSLSGPMKKVSELNEKAKQYLNSAGLLDRSVRICIDQYHDFY